jgi:hypothetical protein
MGTLFSRDYQGGPFELFGTAHLLALMLVVLACLAVWALRKQFTEQASATFAGGCWP